MGTRDAGVICTTDDGKTWRTIKNSERINYVTGFHFYPNGAVHIASWGHGIWFLQKNVGLLQDGSSVLGVRPPVGGDRTDRQACSPERWRSLRLRGARPIPASPSCSCRRRIRRAASRLWGRTTCSRSGDAASRPARR